MNAGNGPLVPRRGGKSRPDPDLLAAQALAFIAADEARLGRFLALTGLDPAALREAAAAGRLTRALLAYVGSDEDLLVALAHHERLDPEGVGQVIRAVTDPPLAD